MEAPVAKESVDHQAGESLLSLRSEKSRLERELRSAQVKAKADIAALHGLVQNDYGDWVRPGELEAP